MNKFYQPKASKLLIAIVVILGAFVPLGVSTTLAEAAPDPSTISCAVTQDGKDVKSNEEILINPITASTTGGLLNWTAAIKYTSKYISSYTGNTPNYSNNLISFTWTATVDGKTFDMVKLSDNPYSNWRETTSGAYKYRTSTYKLFGSNYNLQNPNHKSVQTKAILKTAISGTQTVICNVNYKAPAVSGGTNTGTIGTSTGTGTTTGTGATTSTGSTSSSASGTTGDTTESGAVSTTPLTPSPDILRCSASSKVLHFEKGEPTYDRISATCVLQGPAYISAYIYNKSYDVKSADNSANLIKTFFTPEKLINSKGFEVTWNGFDNFDQPVPLEEYRIVVAARINSSYLPDISIQNFTVEDKVEEVTPATETKQTTTTTTTTTTELRPAAPAVVASKCPGTNYPTDIENSPVKALILQAYDLCFIKGYPDGTFKGQQNITRAEAAKIAVLGAGKIAKEGCYDADCGSPFLDLVMWQGPWVRAAWELKMVVGVSPSQYAPNRNITKAEAASLLVKALKIAPHIGCYNASCGAGYPDDIFLDVVNKWQGPYLRALWDIRAIHSVSPHKYYPDTAITREEFVEVLMKARGQ